MPRDALIRKLEVNTLHAHVDREPPDYRLVFKRLAALPADRRVIIDDDRLVAVPRLAVKGDLVQLIVLEGPVGVTPVIYNTEHQTERAQPLQPGDVLVNRTHAVIDLNTRRAIVEYNSRGAKASDVAAVLQYSARQIKRFAQLQLSLTPVISEAFAEALEEFERIKSARVRLRRPNFDWSDWADHLTDAAGESEAQAVNVEFTARRNRSLSKRSGVVGFLKRATSGAAPSPIESASVVGRRAADDGDTTISTRGFVENRRVSMRRGRDGQVLDAEAFHALIEYDEELREGQDPAP